MDSADGYQNAVSQCKHSQKPQSRVQYQGNDYRLVVAIAYRLQVIYVKFIGTHAQYDAIDAETVEVA